jgi:hypothetical protein
MYGLNTCLLWMQKLLSGDYGGGRKTFSFCLYYSHSNLMVFRTMVYAAVIGFIFNSMCSFIVEILMQFIHISCKSSGSGHINWFDFIHFVILRIHTEHKWYFKIISHSADFAMVKSINMSGSWALTWYVDKLHQYFNNKK